MKARVFLSLALALPAAAHSFTVQMMHVTPEGIGQLAGTVVIEDSAAGARLTPDLRGLPPGPHGFHLHQNGDCGPTVVDGKATPPARRAGTGIRPATDITWGLSWATPSARATRATCPAWKFPPMAASTAPWLRHA